MKIENSIVLCILTVAIILLIIHLSTNDLEFSRYNLGWNGTSGFFELFDRHTTEEIHDLSELSGRKNSTLLIIAPVGRYSATQISSYRSYLESGNRIFLADDFGTGNELLRGLNSSIRILPGTLSSVDRAYNDSYAIVTSPFTEDPLTTNTSSLVLDRASALEGGEPLFRSSLMSWIDNNDDHQISNKEMLGKYTVLSREKIGRGEILVLSDPSIFINSMGNLDDQWGNKKFIGDLLRLYQPLLIDQTNSRTQDSIGISWLVYSFRTIPVLKISLAGCLLIGLIFFFGRREHD